MYVEFSTKQEKMKKRLKKGGSHREVYSYGESLLHRKQIINAGRVSRSVGVRFILFDKLKFAYLFTILTAVP